MKASEIIGDSVLVLADAKICGTVSNLIFGDKLKKVAFLEILIDDEDDCEVRYLAVGNIFSIEKDMLTVKYPSSLVSVRPVGAKCPINLPMFDESGKSLGLISDVLIDGLKTVSLITAQFERSIDNLLSMSDALVVMRKHGSTTKLGRSGKKIPKIRIDDKNAEPRKVVITSLENPIKIFNDYSFMFGKKTNADITALSGQLVIPCGSVISDGIVCVAKKYGVVAQLALSAT